ncbi:hypothetical protein AB8A21_01275 [Streptomyces sp. BF23-18]|uniref:hypothetical protein n=1 Tax=Streptomyces sp. BF23-18 TaxID=3240282 RepID=UPI0034E560F5
MTLERTLRDPVQLLDPAQYVDPVPTPGCDVCAALARQLKEAREPHGPKYDASRASDIVVEMRRHQEGVEGK